MRCLIIACIFASPASGARLHLVTNQGSKQARGVTARTKQRAGVEECQKVEQSLQVLNIQREISRLNSEDAVPDSVTSKLTEIGIPPQDWLVDRLFKKFLQNAAREPGKAAKLMEIQEELFPGPPALPTPKCLAVFDFDQTMTVKHLRSAVDRTDDLWGGKDRVIDIADHAILPLVEAGCTFVVLTRNSGRMVSDKLRQAVDEVGVSESFLPTFVIGNEMYADHVSKSCALETLVQPKFDAPVPESLILFADDDPNNIADMEERFPAATMVRVCQGIVEKRDCHGISGAENEQIGHFVSSLV